MCRIKTLSSLVELQRSGFGQPSPRHGLRLLYWFVNNCVEVNQQGQMISLCSPSTGEFGFRIFHNRDEGGKGSLLPDCSRQMYYELGNLSVFGVKSMPEYVRERYTGFQDKSNTDRLIVCLDSETFNDIYVTRHKSRMNFDPRHTFCISLELVRSIKTMQREDFLRAAKRRRSVRPRSDTELQTEQDHRESQLLTPHTAPAPSPPTHQPPSQELHLHYTHHPHTLTRNICCFILLFLLTATALMCLWLCEHKVNLYTWRF